MSVRNTSSSIYCGYIDAQKWSLVSVNNDEDMTSMYTAKHGEWREDEGDQQGFPSQEEGPKLIRFESPRWRPKTTLVRVHLRVQEQPAQKMTRRSHTESVLNVLYIDGKIISRSFQ